MNWIKFDEQRPPKSGSYLTFDACANFLSVLHYSKKYDLFNAYDIQPKDKLYPLKVTHWCEIELPID